MGIFMPKKEKIPKGIFQTVDKDDPSSGKIRKTSVHHFASQSRLTPATPSWAVSQFSEWNPQVRFASSEENS